MTVLLDLLNSEVESGRGTAGAKAIYFVASSAKSVGKFGLWEFSELMKQCDLNVFTHRTCGRPNSFDTAST